MKKLLLPLLLALLGTGAGVGAGFMLPSAAPSDQIADAGAGGCQPDDAKTAEDIASNAVMASGREFVKMNNQFVVPVVADDRVSSLVVLSLSVEVPEGQADTVFATEPKLRDIFLQELFNHANLGGFDGSFTQANALDALRQSLHESAMLVLGDAALGVLITDIARRDL